MNQRFAQSFGGAPIEVFPDGVLRDFSEPHTWDLGDIDIIFVGGGGLNGPPVFDAGWQALGKVTKPVVLWGIGHNVHSDRSPSLAFKEFLENKPDSIFAAFRDVCANRYVPCPSVMNPAFDNQVRLFPRIFVFAYWHATQPHSPFLDLIRPRLTNFEPNLSRFLNLARISFSLVTNSYHGALWGRMLGLRTSQVAEFSDKFSCMPGSTGLRDGKAERRFASLDILRDQTIQIISELHEWMLERGLGKV